MKTVYLNHHSNIVLDENGNIQKGLESVPSRIDWLYLIQEPMTIVYKNGDNTVKKEVEKNDIIIQFYQYSSGPQIPEIVVVKSEDWVSVITALVDDMNKPKSVSNDEVCDCAKCCDSGN